MEKAKIIKNNIDKVLNHATKLMKTEKDHSDNDKNIYWVFFDKNYNPYWMIDDFDFLSNEFKIWIYGVFKDSKYLSAKDIVASQDFDVRKSVAGLHFFEIFSKNNVNKKIGSTLIDLFEYLSFIKGAKTAGGTALAYRKRIINQQDLLKFYKYKEYDIINNKETNRTHFIKKLEPNKMKDIATNITTIVKDNLAFKVLVPDNLKKQVVELFKEEKEQTKNNNSDENQNKESKLAR